MNFDLARKVADAVLYEGYVLYPYRPSSVKNQFRWQFGVVAPRAWAEDGGEAWRMQTECLVEPAGEPVFDITVRFLQVQAEGPESWDKGIEREVVLQNAPARELLAAERAEPFAVDEAIRGTVRLAVESIGPLLKLRVLVENLTTWSGTDRTGAMRHSLVGTHTLLGVRGGAFVSLIEPPPEAKAAAALCSNLQTFPVLAGAPGERDMMLSSPIILYDYPAVAPESPGDLCDATEIDELLTLRVMTLTEEEKREARAADARARAIVERSDSIPREVFERLHGAVRHMRRVFHRGDRVRIRPRRRSDSMDVVLAGRVARVEAVHRDLENRTYVAVVVEDDPAADLHEQYGRFFYYDPDELEPVEAKEA